MAHKFFPLSLVAVVTLAVTINGIHAVDVYDVINRAGSSSGNVRFKNEIGATYARQTLIKATYKIWEVFQEYSFAERKDVHRVVLIIENFDNSRLPNSPAYATNNEIHLNARYIASYSGDVKREITGVLYHELTHVLQWDGNGQAPGGLIEGIADFVRLKAGYAPSNWVKPGGGDRWDQGYDVTARFLEFCNDGLRSDFVAQLNKKLRQTGYTDDYFRQLLGRTVYQLWDTYKRTYGS